MQAKGCATPMTWSNARRSFYWKLRVRLAQDNLLAKLSEANPTLPHEVLVSHLNGPLSETSDNKALAEQLETLNIEPILAQLKSDYVAQQLVTLASQDRKALVSGLFSVLGSLDEDEKAAMLLALNSSRSNNGGLP